MSLLDIFRHFVALQYRELKSQSWKLSARERHVFKWFNTITLQFDRTIKIVIKLEGNYAHE